jgi:hypothetical protein
MLAQILRKHGLGAGIASYQSVSRERIATLDLTGVAMVCISYLDISGNPAHLRYMIRRLRERKPDLVILVGLWPAGDKALSDPATGREIGADAYVSSLRQAVDSCVREARGGRGV